MPKIMILPVTWEALARPTRPGLGPAETMAGKFRLAGGVRVGVRVQVPLRLPATGPGDGPGLGRGRGARTANREGGRGPRVCRAGGLTAPLRVVWANPPSPGPTVPALAGRVGSARVLRLVTGDERGCPAAPRLRRGQNTPARRGLGSAIN